MPKFLINPITGEFDLVGDGGGGGGSGTVTAVSGGVGITNVPDPIVGAGSVNLDINDLTAESTLAAGDLFAFVDVSSGTTFADQRKVTFGDITAAIAASGTPMAADCASAPALLCLGGRTGTTNDPTISSDASGTITGSADVGGFLFLRGTAVPATFSQVNIAENNVLFLRPITVAGLGGALFFRDNADAFNTAFIAGAQAADINYFLPTSQAASPSLALINDGTGVLSWGAATATCATSPELLCLGGRTSTTNNPTISTDATGVITGSILATQSLRLRGGGGDDVDVTGNGFPIVQIADNVASFSGGFLVLLGISNRNIDLDVTGGPASIIYAQATGTATIIGSGAATMFPNFSRLVLRNDPGNDALGSNSYVGYSEDSVITADGATLHLTQFVGYSQDNVLSVLNVGVLDIDEFHGFATSPIAFAGTHVTEYIGFRVNPTFDDCDDAIGYDVAAFNGTYSNTPISFRSQDVNAYMSHVGQAVFGSTPGQPVPTNASCGLELQSIATAFLPSRLTTAQKNALTALNAMFLYDTDDTKFQGYENGAWVNFTTTVA